jgi:Flp pilus assembly pilin Flp
MVARVMASATAAVRHEKGQALVEYVLVLGLISIVTVALMAAVGTSVTDLLSRVSDRLVSAV